MILPGKFDSCLICQSRKIKDLPGYQRHYLAQCMDCDFVFCNRIPSQQELTKHYAGYPHRPSISSITIARYHSLLDEFEPYRQTNNIVDVGCGDGFFLVEAKKRGWNVYGTEYNDTSIAICESKGIVMKKSPLKPRDFPVDFFDVVTSFEVIEHINNPLEEVKLFAAILRKGGLAYVTTPNFNSISRAYLGEKWNVIEYPEHLCYFSRKTLLNLFLMHGFSARKIETTGFSLQRLNLSVSNNSANNSLDEHVRDLTENRTLFKWLKGYANFFLRMSNKGDALKGFFLKI